LQAIAIAIITLFFALLKSHGYLSNNISGLGNLTLSNNESVSVLVAALDKLVCCNKISYPENHISGTD
jgi:hypothetical protein